MNWRVKAIIQRSLCALPFGIGEHLNREIPRLVGRRNISADAERAVQISLSHHADIVRSNALSERPIRHVLELGTGYNFFTALPLAILGYEVTTIDLAHDVHFRAVRSLLRGLGDIVTKLTSAVAPDEHTAVVLRFNDMVSATSFADFLRRSHIRYLAPYDPEWFTREFEGFFDYVYSHCVFEHIPPSLFPAVLRMLRTVCRDGSHFSHQIDMRDHRSSEGFLIDKKLSYLDYLRFSERRWRFWNGNPIAYTNRWRKEDYMRALRENGFAIDGTNDSVYEGPALPLAIRMLDPQFQNYSESELRVMSTFVYGHAQPSRYAEHRSA